MCGAGTWWPRLEAWSQPYDACTHAHSSRRRGPGMHNTTHCLKRRADKTAAYCVQCAERKLAGVRACVACLRACLRARVHARFFRGHNHMQQGRGTYVSGDYTLACSHAGGTGRIDGRADTRRCALQIKSNQIEIKNKPPPGQRQDDQLQVARLETYNPEPKPKPKPRYS